ncbi:MAG: hypothetical protein RL338_235 [Chloroflexota bacterium]
MRGPRLDRGLRTGAAALLCATLLLPAAAAVVRGAGPGLTLVGAATYLVRPEERRVRVVVDLEVTNRLADTVAGSFYFERANLAVLPGAANPTVVLRGAGAASGGAPSVSIAATAKTHTLLAIGLGRRLGSGETLSLRLRFDLPDPGGAPTRPVRVGSSLVAFPVWAYASSGTGGSSVRVVFPPGFRVTVAAGELPEPTSSTTGETIYRTGPLATPLAFYAYLRADRPADLVATTRTTSVGGRPVTLTIRAWPEEGAWAERTGEIFAAALPLLGEAVGLPFPGEALAIEQASDRATGGYAARFEPSTGTVRVAYDARPLVPVHEAAHAWFNGGLIRERWANEGFAAAYAALVAPALGIAAPPAGLTPALTAAAIPLNAWGGVGESSSGTEDYAYAAAALLADAILERAARAGTVPLPADATAGAVATAGAAALRPVWAAVAAGEAAYLRRTVPVALAAGPDGPRGGAIVEPAAPEATPPDWRVLLDLLEERTGARYDDLWRRSVVRLGEEQLLNERAAARRSYEALIGAGDGWAPPVAVRRALGAWRFETARELIAGAGRALERRDLVDAAAAAIGLEPAAAGRLAYEGEAGPDAALGRLGDELAALEVLAATGELAAAADGRRDGAALLTFVGLLGAAPAAELGAARDAYEAGRLEEAVRRAATAARALDGAEERGLRRLLGALFVLALAGGTAVAVGGALRRRRLEREGPYATLAAPGEPAGDAGTDRANGRETRT